MSANRTGDPFQVIRITRMLCRRLKPFNVRVFRELEAFYFRFALDGEGSCAGGSLTKCSQDAGTLPSVHERCRVRPGTRQLWSNRAA